MNKDKAEPFERDRVIAYSSTLNNNNKQQCFVSRLVCASKCVKNTPS